MNEKKGTGALKSPKDLRNYRIAKVSKTIELPAKFEVEHSHIKDQGMVGSCVAHSVSEVLETKDGVNYSTGWIYGYRPEGYYQGSGMYASQALKTVNKVGYLTNRELDANAEMTYAKELVDKDLEKYKEQASKRKILRYAMLNTIDEIKQAVYTYKKPVVVCIDTDNEGLKVDKNFVAYLPKKEPFGGHAVVCYGWNETGLLIQNSWGEEWGNKGCFILPYSYPFYEAWLIEFEANEEDNDVPIEKPNWYWLRELIMKIIQFIRKLLKG